MLTPAPAAVLTPAPAAVLTPMPAAVLCHQINAWFIEKRNPDTGEYPDFPDDDDGGSKLILAPPPPTLDSLLDGEGDKKDAKGKGGDKAKGGKDKKKGKGRAG